MKNNDEISLIDSQTVGSVIYIISLAITIYLLQNRKKDLEGKPSYPNGELDPLRLFNRVLLIVIYLIFLYVSYKSYIESGARADYIVLVAAVIAVVPPIMQLYAFLLAQEEQNTKNPIL